MWCADWAIILDLKLGKDQREANINVTENDAKNREDSCLMRRCRLDLKVENTRSTSREENGKKISGICCITDVA